MRRCSRPGAADGHREFAGGLNIQVVKVFEHAARTGLHDHEGAAAGYDMVAVGSEARPQGLLTRQSPHPHAVHWRPRHQAAARCADLRAQGRGDRRAIGIAAAAICHSMTADEVSDPDLSYVSRKAPWDTIRARARAWTRWAQAG